MANVYTEAQKRAISKYTSRFANLNIRIQPVLKERLTAHCKKNDISISSFVVKALENQLKLEEIVKKETMQ